MDNNELNEKLSHLQWLLGRRQLRNHMEYGPYSNPSCGQGRVLTLLKMQSDISTRDLSYLLGIRQQSLNELLNKLEKSEYVVREPSEADRRVMLVKLTEKGKAQQQQATNDCDIFTCLTAEEQETLADYLDRITTALEVQLGDKGDECVVTESGTLHGYGYGSHGERRRLRHFDHECHGEHRGYSEHDGHHRHGKRGHPGQEGREGHPFNYGHNRDGNRNEKKCED